MKIFSNHYKTVWTINRLSVQRWAGMNRLLAFLHKFQWADGVSSICDAKLQLHSCERQLQQYFAVPLFPFNLGTPLPVNDLRTKEEWISYLKGSFKQTETKHDWKKVDAVHSLTFQCNYQDWIYMAQLSFQTNEVLLQRSARPSKQANLSRRFYGSGRFIVVDPECYYQCTLSGMPTSGHNIHRLFEDLLSKYVWNGAANTADAEKTQAISPCTETRLIQT